MNVSCGIFDSLDYYTICIFPSLFHIPVISIMHQRIHITGSSIEGFLQLMEPQHPEREGLFS